MECKVSNFKCLEHIILLTWNIYYSTLYYLTEPSEETLWKNLCFFLNITKISIIFSFHMNPGGKHLCYLLAAKNGYRTWATAQESQKAHPINSHPHSLYLYQHSLEIGKKNHKQLNLLIYHQIVFHPSHSSKYLFPFHRFLSLRNQIYYP